MPRVLTADEVAQALTGELSGWSADGDSIVRDVQAESFLSGIRLVDAAADAAERLNHHPDIDIRWTTVTFRLSTHSEGGVTELDLDLARRIDELAAPTTGNR